MTPEELAAEIVSSLHGPEDRTMYHAKNLITQGIRIALADRDKEWAYELGLDPNPQSSAELNIKLRNPKYAARLMKAARAAEVVEAVDEERKAITNIAEGWTCKAAWDAYNKYQKSPFSFERDSVIEGLAMIELIKEIEKR